MDGELTCPTIAVLSASSTGACAEEPSAGLATDTQSASPKEVPLHPRRRGGQALGAASVVGEAAASPEEVCVGGAALGPGLQALPGRAGQTSAALWASLTPTLTTQGLPYCLQGPRS